MKSDCENWKYDLTRKTIIRYDFAFPRRGKIFSYNGPNTNRTHIIIDCSGHSSKACRQVDSLYESFYIHVPEFRIIFETQVLKNNIFRETSPINKNVIIENHLPIAAIALRDLYSRYD